jgi:hypothetical protein
LRTGDDNIAMSNRRWPWIAGGPFGTERGDCTIAGAGEALDIWVRCRTR